MTTTTSKILDDSKNYVKGIWFIINNIIRAAVEEKYILDVVDKLIKKSLLT